MTASTYPGDILEHLRSLLVLLRQVAGGGRGAFEQAARELAVDRSVLRRRMQTLAAWVGAPLLVGRGANLRPTAAGARLVDRAAVLVAAVNRLPAEVAGARERLVVACTGTITTEVLPSVLLDLERSRRAPQLAVRRAGGAAGERLLRGRDVDLAVVRGEAPPSGFASVRLADDRVWVLLPRAHPLAKERARITLERLAATPLVLYGPTSRTRARIMDRLGPLGASVRVEVDGKASALAYVRAGLGASFASLLPGHTVVHPGVVARDVTSLFALSGFYLAGLRERWTDPAVQRVVQSIVHHARSRPGQ
jgi:DNA-binding transcriptional LysR family regulator